MAAYGQQKTGFGYLRIKRTDLIDILVRAVRREGVEIQFDHHLVALGDKADTVQMAFKNGVQETADLLLGCDGIHSAVRRIYVDPEVQPRYSGISNVYGLVNLKGMPATTVDMNDLHATLTTDGLLATSGCANSPDDTVYWFFSREIALPGGTDVRDGWEQSSKREIENVKSTLLDLLGTGTAPWNDFLRALIEGTESVKFYPIYFLPVEQRWAKGRCLLLGDAAHAMPPHASQGTSMAIEDVTLLSNLMARYPDMSIDNLVTKYESFRRPRILQMLSTAQDNGVIRHQTPASRLAIDEFGYSIALKLFSLLNLDNYGVGQRNIAYDVEQKAL